MAPIDGNGTKLLQTYQGLYNTVDGEMSASGCRLPSGQFFANIEQRLLSFGTDAMQMLDMNTLEMSAKSTGSPNSTMTLQRRENLLWVVSIMHFNNTSGFELQADWPGAPVIVQECGLYWCVNQYWSSVANNTHSESVEEVPARRVRNLWNNNGSWPDKSLEFHDSSV